MNPKQLFKEGFLPGPKESREEFLDRIDITNHLRDNPQKLLKYLDLKKVSFVKDFSFPACRGKYAPWKGGMTYICNYQGHNIPILILPNKSGFLVSKEEIIEHEMVHVRRASFPDKKYEEFLAYGKSKSRIQRYLGPAFTSNTDIFVFLFTTSIFPMFTIYPPFAFPFLCFTTYLAVRLTKGWTTVKKAFKRLNKELCILLTDQEIETVAKGKKIKDNGEIRWDFAREIFPEIVEVLE